MFTKFLTSSNFLPNIKSIKFWLAFFFVIRLIGITNPPLERGHDWRQCLTSMMSRNLYETNNNPFYPTVDNGGLHPTGIIASEFPVFNYLIYLVCLPFGYAHWYGRLINLILTTLACWYFYKLLKEYFSESISFNATFILTVSLWFGYARKTMPDIFSMSLMIIAFYHALLFFKETKWWRLVAYGILASLAILAKLPAIFALSILALPILSKNYSLLPKISIALVSVAAFGIMYWWYFVWGAYLLKTYGYQLYFPFDIMDGINAIIPLWNKALEQFYFTAFQSFIAFAMFLYGLYFCFKNKLKLPLLIFGVSFPVFAVFIIKTGSVFPLHTYYIIPFVPIMAIIAGIGLSKISPKIYVWILTFITIEAIANQQNDFFIIDQEKFKLTLEQEINKTVPKNEKIAMAGTIGPQYLYFAHRKGWGLSVEQTLDTSYMNYLIDHEYNYMVLIKRNFSALPKYKIIADKKDIIIYDLRK